MRLRLVPVAFVALAAAVSFAEETPTTDTAVAASNGVVVHGVDTKLLAARLRDADRKVLAGDATGAAADLAEILTGDVSKLIEDGENAYLSAREAALQRVIALPPEGIARFRAATDARAATVLAAGVARADAALLARHATEMALTSHGPELLVTLCDLRAARGEARLAGQALVDLLRFWPDSGPTAALPGAVDRAAVVGRLASICASLGDEASVRWLERETSATLLDGPSPVTPGGKLSDDLARCAASAALRGRSPDTGPAAPLQVVAEKVFSRETFNDIDPARSREIFEHPIAIGTREAPALLTREPQTSRNQAKVIALAPSPAGGGELVRLWSWPSDEEFRAGLRRGGRGAFAPARCGELVIFPWPMEPQARSGSGGRFESADDEHNTLVVLSPRAEGRLVDERGAFEEKRDDADPELLTMSFCGRPLVVGDSVFATLVRRAENGGATELHVARFDLVAAGATQRLHLRWRRHVLDGEAMPPVTYPSERAVESEEPLAAPAAMAERWGRIYVASNTGAVACLDGADGASLWVQAYPRFGPPLRHAVAPAVQRTWKDVPVSVDGPYVWAAPRDAESLLQFRAMPRLARTTLVQSWRLQGGAGTATEQGALLSNVVPDEVVAVAGGVGWFSGRVPGVGIAGLVPAGSPLASLRMRPPLAGEPRRSYAYAQIAESAPSGSPSAVPGAILFPTVKGIYRVGLGDFEAAPHVLWKPPPSPRGTVPADRIGTLVADGERLWSVTPRRVVLFATQ